MLDFLCVLRSGGGYDATWVRKLKDALARNVTVAHRLRCLSDVEVPCDRIPLEHDWPGWWAKIEMFKKGLIEGPTVYLDLDTVLMGNLDSIANVPMDFCMLRNFWSENMVGSGVMWFSGENVPHGVYTKFARQADAYIKHHERMRDGPYVGDQAFIWDALDRNVEQLNDYFPGIYSYKMHCRRHVPKDARIICFHGEPKLPNVEDKWIKENWL